MKPVLDAIVESAARVCGIDDVVLRLREGDVMVARAHFGPVSIGSGGEELSINRPQICWIREHGTLHVPDVAAQNELPKFGKEIGICSFLGAPLRQHGELVGMLAARRTQVRPFTLAQIKLLETFADQAVIAVENVRLFQELKESLEQQTATSEILGVIASSPTDIQPVLDAIAQSAARVCGSDDATIRLLDGDEYSPGGPHLERYHPPYARRTAVERRDSVPAEALLIDNQLTVHIPGYPSGRTQTSSRTAHTWCFREVFELSLSHPLQREANGHWR